MRVPDFARCRAPITAIASPASARRQFTSSPLSLQWKQSQALDQWVQRDARPISLKQLTFFGRSLDEERILSSANYVRTELPTRIAHRLRDMQTLPYTVVRNRHLSHVYNLYFRAFDSFRQIPEVQTLEDNERFCQIISGMLKDHLTVIPRLVMGVIEVQDQLDPNDVDRFITTLLRSVSSLAWIGNRTRSLFRSEQINYIVPQVPIHKLAGSQAH